MSNTMEDCMENAPKWSTDQSGLASAFRLMVLKKLKYDVKI